MKLLLRSSRYFTVMCNVISEVGHVGANIRDNLELVMRNRPVVIQEAVSRCQTALETGLGIAANCHCSISLETEIQFVLTIKQTQCLIIKRGSS